MTDKTQQKIYLQAPSPLEMREEFVQMIYRDLHGPVGGEHEVVDEASVRGRYILGLLAPNNHAPIPEPVDEMGDLAVDGSDDEQDGHAEPNIPDVGETTTFMPSSMGLTFSIDRDVSAIQVNVRWGNYQREEGIDGDRIWQRYPIEKSKVFELIEGKITWFPIKGDNVYVSGLCRQFEDSWSITLFLVNGQEEPKQLKDQAWLFQPQIIVTAPDNRPIFIKRTIPSHLSIHNIEDRMMQMLYRHRREFSMGHGVGVHVDATSDGKRAFRIETSVVPTFEVERVDAPQISDLVVDMKILSELQQGQFSDSLTPLVSAYRDWLKNVQAVTEDPPADLIDYVEGGITDIAIKDAYQSLERIEAGIALLDSDTNAAEAFQFTNRAMWYQRTRSIYANQVRQGQTPDETQIDIEKNRSWRPFQLAFLLLNLPSMVDPSHPDRSGHSDGSELGIADLLWFPTGGGKTEAYLGLAAFTMGIRRLQGDLGGLGSHAGVTVLMRYTLRLLTLQQFQRATTLIASCEIIRRDDPRKWGLEPFRIGLWVGQKSTPNWTTQAEEAITKAHGEGWGGNSSGGTGTPAQLTNCPWCGKPIDPKKNIRVETYQKGRARTFQFCSDPIGRCPFSQKQAPDEGLPIIVVDEEIYRRLPTLLIATVDKFAQMPWKGETQMLFGRVNGYCTRHGYRSPEIEDAGRHPKKGYLPKAETIDMDNLRPPDLIIQDELHLISGPLGTLVGLYETAIDALCSWELNGKTVQPKIVASTATIRRASEQVHNLFTRDVKIFPPPGLDSRDNFFSKQSPSTNELPSRLYLGICASGTRLKSVLIRTYVASMAAAQMLYEKYGKAADPYMTLVGYFNSMRELGGMRRVMDDAVSTRLRRMSQRGLRNRSIIPTTIDELTSRKGAEDIPIILDKLETGFDPEEENKYPLDAVLATNMISVGVDVSRLGLMVVAGQPKATAEYIQATSRVGRRHPGVVLTVYNWSRPRDVSHYERFEHYHATFYQQVEALSVTPFAPRALDRGLSGMLVSLMRLMEQTYNANGAAENFHENDELAEIVYNLICKRVAIVDGQANTVRLVEEMLQRRIDEWLHTARKPASVLGYKPTKSDQSLKLLHLPTERDWDTFTCLNSLRDVEPNIQLVLNEDLIDDQ